MKSWSGPIKRTQIMKGKRFSTEEKVRILREVDAGKSIVDICREKELDSGPAKSYTQSYTICDHFRMF